MEHPYFCESVQQWGQLGWREGLGEVLAPHPAKDLAGL